MMMMKMMIMSWKQVIGIVVAMCAGPLLAREDTRNGLLKRMPNEAMSGEHLRFKVDPVKRAESQSFHRDRTVPDWRQAMPIGNGDFGAAVHGYPDNLTFHIGKNDLWWDNKDRNEDYPKIKFAELREKLKTDEKAALTKNITRKHEDIKRVTGLFVETAAGKFKLHLHEAATFGNVKEKLDLANGIASTTYDASCNGPRYRDGAKVESFVSREDEVMVIRAQANSAGASLGVVKFDLYRGAMEKISGWAGFQELTVEEIDAKYQPKPQVKDGLAWFTMSLRGFDEHGPDEYVMMLGCDSDKMAASALGPDIYGRFRPDAGPVTFYITVVSNNDVRGPWADPAIKGQKMLDVAKARIHAALAKGYKAVRKSHTDWWNNYWRRGWAILPDKNDEHPWYWSLYKVASAQRPGKVCPGYNGPWRNNTLGSWGYYLYNYEETKHQMGILSNNRCELVEPINAVAFNTRERMRKQTREYFGMEGLHYPHSMSYRGYTNPYGVTPLNVETAGEAIKYAWDYYDYTGDMDWLLEVAYPLLKGVADFYFAYLQEDENGNYYIFPSYWTEHHEFFNTSINDLALFHMVFRDAVKAAKVLGVDADRVANWQKAREKLLPFNTNKDGVWVATWDSDAEGFFKGMLSNSQTYPISIADLVDAWHGPAELRKQARVTYAHFLGSDPVAWDKSTSYIAAARMGDRKYMKKIYGIQYELIEGGYLWDDGRGEWPQFLLSGATIDPCGGYPAGIATESMLQSQGGDIRLFAANPLEGHYAFHSLRARGAFLVSSEMRDGKVPYALIQSLAGNRCVLVQPFGEGVDVQVRDLASGKIVKQVEGAGVDQIISFDTTAKHVYVIERKDVPLEKVPVIKL